MSLYAGVNNTPKKVASLLIGVNNVVKAAVAAYAGSNGTTSKVYESLNIDQELGNVNPVKALTSGKITSDYIGKSVYLSNSVVACQEWRIADINHDGIVGTVDLFPKYVFQDSINFSICSTMNTPYSRTNVRSWLNGTFYNGFDDTVKNAIKTQTFISDDDSLSDKVKCPSIIELGVGLDNENKPWHANHVIGGTIYPIFGSEQKWANELAKLYSLIDSTNYSNYITRSLWYTGMVANCNAYFAVNHNGVAVQATWGAALGPTSKSSSGKPNKNGVGITAIIRF